MAHLPFLEISVDLEVLAEITNLGVGLVKRYLTTMNEEAGDYLQRQEQDAHAGCVDAAVQAS
jgi:hypothetical protein